MAFIFSQEPKMVTSCGVGIIESDIKEPVNSLAEKCGYANAQTFRRAFKKKYGLTPSEFKQKVFAESGEL